MPYSWLFRTATKGGATWVLGTNFLGHMSSIRFQVFIAGSYTSPELSMIDCCWLPMTWNLPSITNPEQHFLSVFMSGSMSRFRSCTSRPTSKDSFDSYLRRSRQIVRSWPSRIDTDQYAFSESSTTHSWWCRISTLRIHLRLALGPSSSARPPCSPCRTSETRNR